MTPLEARPFFPSARFGDVHSVASISPGLSGAAVYSVATDVGDFVLRLEGSDATHWESLARANRLAAEHGIAPALVHVDAAARASVSVQITALPFGAAMAQPAVRPVVLRNVVKQLARLHAIPLEGTPPNDPVGAGRSIWDGQVSRPGFPSWAVGFGGKITAAGRALESDTRRVFSHNDMHPSNVLWDGSRAWIVDWERAGLSHPYIDLATFSNFLNLSDEDALGLVSLHEGAALDDTERATFLCLRDYSRAVYGAVFLRLVPDLTAVPLPARAKTPTLAECYQRIAAGALDMTSPSGQALLGGAFLRQVSP